MYSNFVMLNLLPAKFNSFLIKKRNRTEITSVYYYMVIFEFNQHNSTNCDSIPIFLDKRMFCYNVLG